MLFREKFFAGGRVSPLVVESSERAGGDVDVLRKPLILNPAGTEGPILINAHLFSGCFPDEMPTYRYLTNPHISNARSACGTARMKGVMASLGMDFFSVS